MTFTACRDPELLGIDYSKNSKGLLCSDVSLKVNRRSLAQQIQEMLKDNKHHEADAIYENLRELGVKKTKHQVYSALRCLIYKGTVAQEGYRKYISRSRVTNKIVRRTTRQEVRLHILVLLKNGNLPFPTIYESVLKELSGILDITKASVFVNLKGLKRKGFLEFSKGIWSIPAQVIDSQDLTDYINQIGKKDNNIMVPCPEPDLKIMPLSAQEKPMRLSQRVTTLMSDGKTHEVKDVYESLYRMGIEKTVHQVSSAVMDLVRQGKVVQQSRHTWMLVDNPVRTTASREEIQTGIFNLLKAGAVTSQTAYDELTKSMTVTKTSVQVMLRRLKRDGHLDLDGHLWSLPGFSKQQLQTQDTGFRASKIKNFLATEPHTAEELCLLLPEYATIQVKNSLYDGFFKKIFALLPDGRVTLLSSPAWTIYVNKLMNVLETPLTIEDLASRFNSSVRLMKKSMFQLRKIGQVACTSGTWVWCHNITQTPLQEPVSSLNTLDGYVYGKAHPRIKEVLTASDKPLTAKEMKILLGKSFHRGIAAELDKAKAEGWATELSNHTWVLTSKTFTVEQLYVAPADRSKHLVDFVGYVLAKPMTTTDVMAALARLDVYPTYNKLLKVLGKCCACDGGKWMTKKQQ